MEHVYVHIPFCDSICYYCDFTRFKENDAMLKQWKETLINEIEDENISSISTLYFGGGTPSLLTETDFTDIANCFLPYLNKEYEWSVECNPDSITLDKLKVYKKLGVNRISLGVQTFNDSHLSSIGRRHTKDDIYHAIENIRSVGIENISIDLIYGLPNQTLDDIKENIHQFLKLKLPHLSIYSLQIEEQSVFGKKGIQPCDEELEADMYDYIQQQLEENGYIHYEISSYCKENMESKHNMAYWQDEDFIGLGLGASGREKGIRYDHTNSLKEYSTESEHKHFIQSTVEDKKFESIMMSLRTIYGLNIEKWNQKYNGNFVNEYQNVLDTYSPDYLYIEENCLKCTKKGMEILNTILVDFL